MAEELNPSAGTSDSSGAEGQAVAPVEPTPTQPTGAEPAPEVRPEAGPGPDWVPAERLRKYQSAADRRLKMVDDQRQALEAQVAQMREKLRNVELRGMTEQEKAAYHSQELQEEAARKRNEDERREIELQRQEYEYAWLKRYLSRGVPPEVLDQAMQDAALEGGDFGYVHDAVLEWSLSRSQQPPVGSESPKAPPVRPTDRVQSPQGGVPPSSEFLALVGGERVDMRKLAEIIAEARRTGRIT